MEDPEVPVKAEPHEKLNQNGVEKLDKKPKNKKKLTKKVTKRKKENENSSEDEDHESTEIKSEKKKRKKKSKKTFERRNIKALFTEDKLEESTKNALVS